MQKSKLKFSDMNLFFHLIKNIDFWSAVLGFIGTVLIFKFGLPPKVDPEGHIHLICEQENENEKKKGRTYKKLGYIGIFLIGIAYFLQLLKLIFIS